MRTQYIISILVCTLLMQCFFAAIAGFPPRMIPRGSVELIDSGIILDKEITAPPGMLMKCRGECVIEAQGIQLIGSDKTVFGIHDTKAAFAVVIQRGSVDFALRADAKSIDVTTPFETIHLDPAKMPGAGSGMVRGNIAVDQDKATLALTDGSMNMQTAGKTATVEPGKSVVMAQRVPQPATVQQPAAAKTAGVAGVRKSGSMVTDAIVIGSFAAGGGVALALAMASDRNSHSKEISPY